MHFTMPQLTRVGVLRSMWIRGRFSVCGRYAPLGLFSLACAMFSSGCAVSSETVGTVDGDSEIDTEFVTGETYCPSQYGGVVVDVEGAHCLCGELPLELTTVNPATDEDLLRRFPRSASCGYTDIAYCKDDSYISVLSAVGISPLDDVRPVGVDYESATKVFVFDASTRSLVAYGYVPDDDDGAGSCDVAWYGDVQALECFDTAVLRLRESFDDCALNRSGDDCPICECAYDGVFDSLDCQSSI